MPAINIVPVAEIQTGTRFDAEFYHPKYEDLEDVFHRLSDCKKLGVLCNSVRKGIFDIKPSSYTSSGIPLIRTFQIKSSVSGDDALVFISETDHLKHYIKTELFSGDIVLTKIGAGIGDVAILSNTFERYNFSQNVAGLSIRRGKIDPYYLIAFLTGKYRRKQIVRYMMPSGQGKLELRDIKKIKVPRLGQSETKIASLIRESERLLHSSKEQYAAAQQLLESELGLDKLRFDKPVGYTTRFSVVGLSDSVSANRIDAQCFSPEAVFYEDWLLKHANCGRLSLLLSSTAKGRQQVETETGTTDYCSIKHITSREIVGASKAYPAAGTPTARKDDLLLAITGATIGKIGIVNRYDNLVFSGDMLRLRANGSIYPHYLLLTLDHHLGQVQFNRWITGSTNGHLAPRDVGRVLVPRLAPEKEEQIAALVAESLEKRQESEQLLDQAKSRVEQLIEEAMRA